MERIAHFAGVWTKKRCCLWFGCWCRLGIQDTHVRDVSKVRLTVENLKEEQE
jgi:hypothetical protein